MSRNACKSSIGCVNEEVARGKGIRGRGRRTGRGRESGSEGEKEVGVNRNACKSSIGCEKEGSDERKRE